MKIIGRGGFAIVYLVEQKETGDFYALKSVKKLAIIEKNQFESIRREKEILHKANHPFLVGLKCAFSTPDKLFFLMPWIAGGDLSVHLRRRKRFGEAETRFYTTQIVLALNFLHERDIIYQD
jgi:serine/threonine protein kinase